MQKSIRHKKIAFLFGFFFLWQGALVSGNEVHWHAAERNLSQAGVASPVSESILKNAKSKNISPLHVAQWTQQLVKLKQDNLPTESMTDRILQAIATDIPPADIDSALTTLYRDLTWGKNTVAMRISQRDLSANPKAFANTLANLEVAKRQGFNPLELEQILGEPVLGILEIETATGMLTDWRIRGHEPQEILATLKRAIEMGMKNDDLKALDQDVIDADQNGVLLPLQLNELSSREDVRELRSRSEFKLLLDETKQLFDDAEQPIWEAIRSERDQVKNLDMDIPSEPVEDVNKQSIDETTIKTLDDSEPMHDNSSKMINRQ